MKYNLKKIMRRAWKIKREDEKNIFSLCLKMAWEEAKNEKKLREEFEVKEFKFDLELMGSEKQIKWAKDIIKSIEKAIKENTKKDMMYSRKKKCLVVRDEKHEAVEVNDLLKKIKKEIENNSWSREASYWINARYAFHPYVRF